MQQTLPLFIPKKKKNSKMLLAIGSFAYKFYNLHPSHPHAPVMEENIIRLLNKINVKSLKIAPSEHDCECYSLYHEPSFTMSFFVMQAGRFMPLHDHPNMTVFIKVLQGQMLLSAYQFCLNQDGGGVITTIDSEGRKLLKCKKLTRIIGPDSPHSASVLKPDSYNMHCFRALTDDTVFIDIIGPPYNDDDRNCTYFTDLSESDPVANTSNTPPPLLLSDQSDSSSMSESSGATTKFTLSNGRQIPLNVESFVWITEDDIEYTCFSKHYEPHQT